MSPTQTNPALERTTHRSRIVAWLLGLGTALTLAATAESAAQEPRPTPVIGSVFPRSGPPGTILEINGQALSGVDTVRVGSTSAPILNANESSVRFVLPPLAVGAHEIRIVAAGAETALCCFNVTGLSTDPDLPDSDPCALPGYNTQCGDLGSIKMAFYHDIRGTPITVVTEVLLREEFDDRTTRWIMFSLRNVTTPASSPVTINVAAFRTDHGDVAITQLDQTTGNEWTAWVDVLDTPVGVPLRIVADVGSTDRGAYRLEALVMPFDRSYAPTPDGNGDATHLYTFTLLGVNEATASTFKPNEGSLLQGNKTPGPAFAIFLLALGAALAAATGRRHP